MKNRKKVEDFILKWIDKITKSKENVELYKNTFKKMNDKEFDTLMNNLRNGDILNVIIPHDISKNISVENNLKLAKELGIDFFQKVSFKTNDDLPRVLSNEKMFVSLMPFRRTKQTSDKGVSVSENSKKVDLLTGQVTGDSRSSKISFPELQLLNGMGMKDSIKELTVYRSGDTGAMRAMRQSMLKYGRVNSDVIENYSTGTVGSKTLKAYFTAMHLKINL